MLWLPSSPENPPDQTRVTSIDPENLVLVAMQDFMPHLKPNTKQWLSRHGVPVVWASDGSEWSVLEGLDEICNAVAEGEVG